MWEVNTKWYNTEKEELCPLLTICKNYSNTVSFSNLLFLHYFFHLLHN